MLYTIPVWFNFVHFLANYNYEKPDGNYRKVFMVQLCLNDYISILSSCWIHASEFLLLNVTVSK